MLLKRTWRAERICKSAFRDYKGALSELEAARAGLPNDPRILELTGYILRQPGQARRRITRSGTGGGARSAQSFHAFTAVA